MIKVNNITKKYDNRMVLNNISFSMTDESFISIIGKSGSGKSTLMSIIGSLIKPDSGTVIIDDLEIFKLSEKKIAEFRNKKIGFVFQNFNLEPNYSVYQNVILPLIISGNKNDSRQKAILALSKVGMNNFIDKKTYKLSGGEQQRVCIARAIIQSPKIILADEPCGNLDTHNSDIVMSILKELSQQNHKIILITHNPEAAKKTERILTLNDGILLSDSRNIL